MIGGTPTESTDGTVHLTYFDVDTQASFVWSGSAERPIQVSIGGYGEPVFDEFWPRWVLSDSGGSMVLHHALLQFRRACDGWLAAHRPAVLETWQV